jgi:SAM-dependent methyltransferase
MKMGKSSTNPNPPVGKGVRNLTLFDQLPDCEIRIAESLYNLSDIARECVVLDIGCGFGRNRSIVEGVGGRWIGVEPFEGGQHTVAARAENLPFADNSFDVIIMDAVLEHLPNVEASFHEVARVLRPGGVFIGYVAFMECFHEISYTHLSFKALESLSCRNNLNLVSIGGGGSFGIDYHLAVLLYPIPFGWGRIVIAHAIRALLSIKAVFAYFGQRFLRGRDHVSAWDWARHYYKLECLRQSTGFQYIIRKPSDRIKGVA